MRKKTIVTSPTTTPQVIASTSGTSGTEDDKKATDKTDGNGLKGRSTEHKSLRKRIAHRLGIGSGSRKGKEVEGTEEKDNVSVATVASELSHWSDDVMINDDYRSPTERTPAPGERFAAVVRRVMNVQTPVLHRVPGSPVRGKIEGPGDEKAIVAALTDAEKKGAPVLVLGYSPTGNGHTPRCLNVAVMAADKASLVPGSVVVLHVPQKWTGKDRPKDLVAFANYVRNKGINVINLEADKSVQGFINEVTGESLDAPIIHRQALLATRPPADVSSITKGEILPAGDGTTPLSAADYNQDFPSISAKDLFESMKEVLSTQFMSDNVRVFDDMAPFLHKAAHDCGVPDNHRVAQSNHGILLNLHKEQHKKNLASENAILGKVMGGSGEKVAHIGLGDRNSLSRVNEVLTALGVTPSQTRRQGMETAVKHLLEKGIDINSAWAVTAFDDKNRAAGIMRHPGISKPEHVDNVVFVYAHANQNRIARHVQATLAGPNVPEEYKKTLFVFCGKALNSGLNVLQVCYVADACGAASMGCGISGEFAQLRKTADSGAGLLALPILHHAEQKVNTEVVEKELVELQQLNLPQDAGKECVTVLKDSSKDADLNGSVDAFVKKRHAEATAKYADDRTMKKFFASVNDPNTYVAHAYNLLFNVGKEKMTDDEKQLRKVLGKMHTAPLIDNTMIIIKAALQVADRADAKGNKLPKKPRVTLDAQKNATDSTVRFKNFREFLETIQSDDKLATKFNMKTVPNENDIPLLKWVRTIYGKMASPHASKGDIERYIQALKDQAGKSQKMGF